MSKNKTRKIDSIIRAGVFLGVLILSTFVMTIAWDYFLHEQVYDCADSVPFGYLQPGSWVHDPIVYVDKIHQGGTNYSGDVIKTGWSLPKLWMIWFAMFGGSLVVGFLAALSISRSTHETECRTLRES
jgi:hypothetical protein